MATVTASFKLKIKKDGFKPISDNTGCDFTINAGSNNPHYVTLSGDGCDSFITIKVYKIPSGDSLQFVFKLEDPNYTVVGVYFNPLFETAKNPNSTDRSHPVGHPALLGTMSFPVIKTAPLGLVGKVSKGSKLTIKLTDLIAGYFFAIVVQSLPSMELGLLDPGIDPRIQD
ncbi:hypothetical protein [Synoicihabitans lomoniglobus]|uniref:Uncharacterized protein n=1 Tax=Synoicihabitans lomoniglobus TaxID=2909285 RepID=A0AAF0CR51_9BACT|nr:hypothetical protein [Opitutaceae bacterium LMO-M01]WED66535.1 hypothetical protein PXH66_06690 [Opitutaceae bacterium LMO-M01]